MDPIRTSIERPIAVIAIVLMAVLFGALALTQIPIQLAPEVRKPVVVVTTSWPGAAPAEIEREIVNPQEEQFKGLDGLVRMISSSQTGRGSITLEFAVGTDMSRSLLLVSNRLDRVGSYPSEAGEPVIDGSGSEDTPSAWFILTAGERAGKSIERYGDFAEDVIKERLERVDGVGAVNVYGGVERQLEIIFNPARLAAYRLTVPELLTALRRESVSVSAGDVEEGKRRYIVRAEGRLNTVEKLKEVVIRSGVAGATGATGRVFLRDIAEVKFGYKEPRARIRHKGRPAIAINIVRETGANVIEIMKGARVAVAELKAGPIPRAGLQLEQVYDETIYINGAIDLVLQNIVYGGLLAAGVLLIFLRSPAATLVVSLAIPVSIVASFVAMAALGRTLNVISLAGIAFAVGMVVDAAIVVLENIYRLRQKGLSRGEAAYQGAKQVWGAILVSALTTVLVFVPILVMQLEAGQLFRDIAVAISVSVLLSLVVAVTVIPALSSRLLRGKQEPGAGEQGLKLLPLPIIDHFGRLFGWLINGYAALTTRFIGAGVIAVALISGVAVWGAYKYLPKLEYLPEGNRNLIIGFVAPPAGYNLGTTFDIARRVESVAGPLWKRGEELKKAAIAAEPDNPAFRLPQPPLVDTTPGAPALEHFFFVAFDGATIVGAVASDPSRAGQIGRALMPAIFSEPGTFGIVRQASIFGRGVGGSRSIELDITGPNIGEILAVAQRAAGKVVGLFPRSKGHQFRPLPGLTLGAPELRVVPDRVRLADAGIGAETLALTIDAYNDGVRVEEITVGAERLDLMLKGAASLSDAKVKTQDIGGFPVVTPSGRIVPVAALSEVKLTAGPTQIRHTERRRTVTLQVTPASYVPLETALETMQTKVIDALKKEGVPASVSMSMSGAADQLSQTWAALQWNLLLALAIVYLVMAILFESFVLPLVILITVPVAGAGGVAGLAMLNASGAPQPLDMLTMLGFVILIGIVVNNAILIVDQAQQHQRLDGMTARDAIREAVRNRTRPIFMSTLTSVFGMAPLIFFPGAGSELYRGLGTVVVGGLSLSAVLTLLLTPPLLRMAMRDRPLASPSAAVAPAAAAAE
ncbi:MAG: efflux RND transporter permease subunit [Neomegalonema sp.]|nr:efflux RND transporter permease subunit [Neomegalonema sp.]